MNKEVENVLKLDNRKKYEYFIHKTAAFWEVWSLRDEGGWAELEQGEQSFFQYGQKGNILTCVFQKNGRDTTVKLSILKNLRKSGFHG